MRDRIRRNVAVAIVACVLSGTMLASCGTGGQLVRTSSILTVDAATATVHVLLVSSSTGADGGFNFDGFGDGAMRINIPLGWQVDVTCKNASATLSHSCAIVEDTPLSAYGAPLAFTGASTAAPRGGVGPGVAESFSFVASRVGTYRIACLVSGHEIDGMWDWLDVTRGGLPHVRT
jgi:uncharacterized cupredoxin-like copper-binding protein